MITSRRDFLSGTIAACGGLPLARVLRSPQEAFAFASASDAAAAIRTKRVSSTELTRLALERIDRFNPRLSAVVNVLRESALAEARAADDALARGAPVGPLHGVPITVKDTFEIGAVAVARLRRAGAVLLGCTNEPFLSAAALAGGLGHLSLGSDIGGSIRVPAHFCGIYGHKPTAGVVSRRGHIPPLRGAMVTELPVAGPMARSAADLRLTMEVLGGPDGADAISCRWTLPPPRHTRLAGFRAGYVLDDPLCPVAPEVKVTLESAIRRLRRAGVPLTEGWPGNAVEARAATDPCQGFLAQFEARLKARRVWQDWFRDHDVFLMPTASIPVGPQAYRDLRFWIGFATLTGCPATTAPAGLTAGGFPVGIQIMGPYLEDATPIAFAEAMAGIVGGFVIIPDHS
jgi:amidase